MRDQLSRAGDMTATGIFSGNRHGHVSRHGKPGAPEQASAAAPAAHDPHAYAGRARAARGPLAGPRLDHDGNRDRDARAGHWQPLSVRQFIMISVYLIAN